MYNTNEKEKVRDSHDFIYWNDSINLIDFKRYVGHPEVPPFIERTVSKVDFYKYAFYFRNIQWEN